MVKSKSIFTGIAWLVVVVVIILLLFPFVPLVIWSITKQWPWPYLVPDNFSWGAWSYVFSTSGRGLLGLANSILIAFMTLAVNLILGIPAARVLAQHQFKGKIVIFLILLSPLFIPFTVSTIGMYRFSLQIDFLNEYIKVMLAHVMVTLPYFIATIWFQFRLMGLKLKEAAVTLGAKQWQTFLWIELPYLRPALSLASLLVFIISLSQYLPTWIMSGGTLVTLPLVMFPFASNGDASLVSAYSLLFFIPIIAMVLIHLYLIQKR